MTRTLGFAATHSTTQSTPPGGAVQHIAFDFRSKHLRDQCHLCREERMRLKPLSLNDQLHHAVQGAVVEYRPFPSREEVGDNAFEQRQVHFQELGEIHILAIVAVRCTERSRKRGVQERRE